MQQSTNPTPALQDVRELRAHTARSAHAERATAFLQKRYAETIQRHGQPPADLVAAIRDGSEYGPCGARVTLPGDLGCVIALLDGLAYGPNPYAAAEVWRHLNEVTARHRRHADTVRIVRTWAPRSLLGFVTVDTAAPCIEVSTSLAGPERTRAVRDLKRLQSGRAFPVIVEAKDDLAQPDTAAGGHLRLVSSE